ncbi:hypothetical protein ABK040_009007 [Willaertia magna]
MSFSCLTSFFPLEVEHLEVSGHNKHWMTMQQISNNNEKARMQQQMFNNRMNQRNNITLQTMSNNNMCLNNPVVPSFNLLEDETLDRLERELQSKLLSIKQQLDCPPDLLANIKFHNDAFDQVHNTQRHESQLLSPLDNEDEVPHIHEEMLDEEQEQVSQIEIINESEFGEDYGASISELGLSPFNESNWQ